MIYLIDGYNLLFKIFHSTIKIENQRNSLIDYFRKKSFLLKLNIHLVFDAHKQNKDTSSILRYDNLKIIYTAKGQTADDYILAQIFLSKKPQQITVVTLDNSLKTKAKNLNAQTQSIELFINWLEKKEGHIHQLKKNENSEMTDTKNNIERLLKIFEGKLKDNTKDYD